LLTDTPSTTQDAVVLGRDADLTALAAIARGGDGPLLVTSPSLVVQREGIAALMAAGGTAALIGQGPAGHAVRAAGGRVTSAASEHHTVTAPTGTFTGALKIAAADRERAAAAAERAAELPARDLGALLLVALVRAGIPVAAVEPRGLYWARPSTDEERQAAREQAAAADDDRVRLDSAVKAADGFFTTFFVSSYSKYVARWAARRGLTPNAVTVISLVLGIAAAAAFAAGTRPGLIAGAVLLQIAFMADCVDGQLARYTRNFSATGAWMDAIFDRAKEYLVFAGLAIGASRMGEDVWLLAGAALALQTVRHAVDFSYPTTDQLLGALHHPPLEQAADGGTAGAPAASPGRNPGPLRWVKRIVQLPIGERFAVVSVTAAVSGPRTTFVVLLAWGTVAALYVMAGRARGAAQQRVLPAEALRLGRDDGPIAAALGRVLAPVVPVPALLALLIGALPVLGAIAVTRADARIGVVAAVVAWLVLWGGVSAGKPLREPASWAAPALLRAAEYGALLWIGVEARAAAFALLAAIAFHHYDVIYRERTFGTGPPEWLCRVTGGWDGRLAVATVLLAAGALPAGYYAAAGLLGAVYAGEAIHNHNQQGDHA
jgi:hypothetical protein